MKTVLIIHGIGGHAGIHWQQWLHDELAKREYIVLMPNLPDSDHPDRQTWLREIEKTLKGVELNDLIIVGHSLGVTAALDFLEQSESTIDALVAVSGFAEAYGADLNQYYLTEKSIDFQKVKNHVGKSMVMYGDDDPYVTQDALRYVADSLGVEPMVIHEGGHLNTDTGYTTFPDLLKVIEELN